MLHTHTHTLDSRARAHETHTEAAGLVNSVIKP